MIEQSFRGMIASAGGPSGMKRGLDPGSQGRIREAAYFLWERAGNPHGQDVEFWCAAELSQARDCPIPKPKRLGHLTMPRRMDCTAPTLRLDEAPHHHGTSGLAFD